MRLQQDIPTEANKDYAASFSRNALKYDFVDMILSKWERNDYEAFHLSTVYKSVRAISCNNPSIVANKSPAQIATDRLKLVLPKLFSKLISPNWKRNKFHKAFHLFSFLDVPGTRFAPLPRYEITTAQKEFHHHSILLAKPRVADRIHAKLTGPSDPGLIVTRTIDESGFGYHVDLGRNWPLRSCYLQYLRGEKDLRECSSYAAKAVDNIRHNFPDEAYNFFPN